MRHLRPFASFHKWLTKCATCHVPRTTRKQINFHLLKQQSRLIGKTFAPTFRLSRKDLCTFDRKDCKKKMWTEGRVTGVAADDSMNVIWESISNPISRTPDTFLLPFKSENNFQFLLRLPFTRHQLWPQNFAGCSFFLRGTRETL